MKLSRDIEKKKNAMIIDENNLIMFDLSSYFLCKYSGIVNALYFSVSMRSFSAIRYQDPMIPTIIPNTDQILPIQC